METELFGKKPYHFKKKKCAHTEKKSTEKIMKKKIKGKGNSTSIFYQF